MAVFEESIETVKEPLFQYIPTLDRSAYLRVDLVKKCDLVDGDTAREMIWHRYSYSDVESGPYDELFVVPFGLAAGVSGG